MLPTKLFWVLSSQVTSTVASRQFAAIKLFNDLGRQFAAINLCNDLDNSMKIT